MVSKSCTLCFEALFCICIQPAYRWKRLLGRLSGLPLIFVQTRAQSSTDQLAGLGCE
jgi:hypothetical protein